MFKDQLRKTFARLTKPFMRGWGLSRIPPLGWLYNRIYAGVRSGKKDVAVNGFTMRLDPKDSLGLSVWGIYEPAITALVQDRIKPGMNVIDVGANIGYYTLLFSRLVGSEGKVYAFEPDPENAEILKINLERNNCRNVLQENKALADVPGQGKLYKSEENRGDHRIFSATDRPFVPIELIRLDDYLGANASHVDFIKMDIQGAEYFALQGMRATLLNPKIMMVMEFSPDLLREAGTDLAELVGFLREQGFRLYDINEPAKKIIELPPRWAGEGGEKNLFCFRGSI